MPQNLLNQVIPLAPKSRRKSEVYEKPKPPPKSGRKSLAKSVKRDTHVSNKEKKALEDVSALYPDRPPFGTVAELRGYVHQKGNEFDPAHIANVWRGAVVDYFYETYKPPYTAEDQPLVARGGRWWAKGSQNLFRARCRAIHQFLLQERIKSEITSVPSGSDVSAPPKFVSSAGIKSETISTGAAPTKATGSGSGDTTNM